MDHKKKRDTEHLILQCAPDLDRLEAMFAHPAPYHLTVPKFHTFSGDPKVKVDIDYKTWHHEVVSATEGNAQEVICEEMLHSLKGKAADVAQFSTSYNVTDTLAILDSIFGNVAPAPVLMQELYTNMWNPGESMSDYGTHLMDRMQCIRRLFLKEIPAEEALKLLQDHFYHGLPANYQSTLHYLYDQKPMYEQLFHSARELESELAAGKATAKTATKATKVKVSTAESGKNAVVQEVNEDGIKKKVKKKINSSKGTGTNPSQSESTSCGNPSSSQNISGGQQSRNPGANNGISAGRG